jgi:hypothetical protein
VSTNVLTEYLVGLGFKIDEAQYNKWTNAVVRSGKLVGELGAVVSTAAFAIEKTVEEAAERFEHLYYVAQRNNAAVASTRQLSFGISQIGLAAATGVNAVEHLGAAMRNTPGFKQFVQGSLGLGSEQLKDPAKAVLLVVDKLKQGIASGKYSYPVAAQLANTILGVDEASFKTMLDNNDKALAQMKEHERRAKEAGLNEDTLGKKSVKFMTDLRAMGDAFGVVGDRIVQSFIDPVDKAIVTATEFAESFARINEESGGTLGVLGATASAIGGAAAAFKVLSAAWAFLGPAAAGAAAEAGAATAGAVATTAAASAAAAPVVGGLAAALAAVAWPLILVGGAVGLAALVHSNKDAIRNFMHIGGSDTPRAQGTRGVARLPRGYGGPEASRETAGGLTVEQQEAYIRESALKRGIDPNIAVAVARTEGLGGAYAGDRGSSFGPYQLHYGNVASGGMKVAGLGDEFTKATGLDARNPNTVRQQIDFSLDRAAKSGWAPWHGWRGDRFAGIGGGGGNVTVQANIHVDGSKDPNATGVAVKNHIDRLTQEYSTATRNLMPVTQ